MKTIHSSAFRFGAGLVDLTHNTRLPRSEAELDALVEALLQEQRKVPLTEAEGERLLAEAMAEYEYGAPVWGCAGTRPAKAGAA